MVSRQFFAQPEGSFKKTKLTGDFISEGVAVADLNKDGKTDIVAGYYWFEAPGWARHELAPSRTFDPRKEYSNSFLNLGMDVNLNGWDDVVIVDFPGMAAFWFENPHNKAGEWQKHYIADSVGVSNESPVSVSSHTTGATRETAIRLFCFISSSRPEKNPISKST